MYVSCFKKFSIHHAVDMTEESLTPKMSALWLIFFVTIYYKGKCLRLKNSKDDHKTLARKRGVMKGHKRKTKYRVGAIVKEGYTSVSKARKSLKTSSTTCLSNKLRGLHNMNTY